ncbi:family 43 glycosylhydrolase [Fulvivirga ligni]|uniref:family 43 glycosylhydrolase n=1 Tax=Fulvivirga ligni TaxID=2904246 RepID=UPI001F35AF20|nr:family 43 glycosylhydrolase [Fulvivirga ligni]UII19630.1 family 43 glycosylhydrolase [Fulvivirga ligni]
MNLKNLLFSLVTLAILTQCTTNETPGHSVITQKQVIAGELPDPSIIEVDGTYYATGSSNDWAPIYPIYKSTDLENWSFLTYVFQEAPAWTINSYWAPELYYDNGTFYCYYTARRTDGTSCIGVASTKNIEKGFTDHGVVVDWGSEAIDAFVYKEGDTKYITWKAYGLNPDKPIQILGAPLSADGLSLNGEAFEVITADTSLWEEGGSEGQCILKKGDYLYLLYSGNACCGGLCDYQVGVARAKSMKGPWEKYESNPILKGNETWKCPGHGTALQTNDSWYYLYHSYHEEGFPYLGRTVLLSELLWDEDSQWPYFEVDSTNIIKDMTATNFSDDFEGDQLNPLWRFNVSSSYSATLENGKLQLSADSAQANAIIFLGVNPDVADFTISTTVEKQENILKGLCIYATPGSSIGAGIRGDSIILWSVENGNFQMLNSVVADVNEPLSLKAKVVEGHLAQFSYHDSAGNWQLINEEEVNGKQLAWWSWGIKAGVFYQGTEGAATFDRFSVEYE